MSAILDTVKSLIPALEAAISREEDPAKRRAFATGTNCMRASEYGKIFLLSSGVHHVRREVHCSRRMGHAFLTLLDEGVDVIGMSDLIVDPTYLQFASPSPRLTDLPNTFVGNRQQVIELMNDTNFTANPHAAGLYLAETWVPSKT